MNQQLSLGPLRHARLEVLVVEDEKADAEIARGMLHAAPFVEFVTECAQTLEDALLHLNRKAWDAVIVDLCLSDSDGMETLRRIRAESADAPIIALTGTYDEESEQDMGTQLLQAGADDYVPKRRLDPDRLRRAVVYACTRHELARHEARLERDLQEQSRRVQIKERVEVVRSEFINRTAHAVRTPLTPILLNASRLQRHSDEAVRSMADVIQRNAQRMRRVMEELSLAAGMRDQGIHVRLQPVAPARLCKDVVAEYQDAAASTGVHIEAGRDDCADVLADADKLDCVLGHLVDNAIKYTPAGGHIRVSWKEGIQSVTIQVADEGRGLEDEEMQHVFDGLYESEAPRGGIGLGLHLAKRFVDAMGGELGWQSMGRGHGATFSITLPKVRQSVYQVEPGPRQ